MREVDYLIIGAGIAGMTLYRCLEERDVAVVDPSPGRYKIGESIVPQHFFPSQLRPLLEIARALPSASEKLGTLFVSREGESFFHAYFDAHFALHVDRQELERACLETLRVPVLRERVESVELERREVTTDQGAFRVRKQILDCSGPAMVLARRAGLARELWPAFASWAYWDVGRVDDRDHWRALRERGAPFFRYDDVEQRVVPAEIDDSLRPSSMTTLTRHADGIWAWQIPLRGARLLSLGVVSRHGPVSRDEYLAVARSVLAAQWDAAPRAFDGKEPHDRFHVRNHFAWVAEQYAGPGFALVGDAAFFGDPVYSVGTALATNQAIRVAELLPHWQEGGLELYQRVTSELFARARRAYEHWYRDEVTREPAVAEEIQSGFLNGLAFHARTGAHYLDMWGAASPVDAAADPHATGDPGRDVTEIVGAWLAPGSDWSLVRAHIVVRSLRLSMRHASVPEFDVVIALRAEVERSYREVGPFALSYRARPELGLPTPALAMIDSLARSIASRQRQVLALLEMGSD